ncbi:MAG: class I SAM-dependent methyltransferase [Hyphomicrobiales bacterium]|nr:class I SAM-dependent methyltransferase [Hyphomicrobiales bacterium]
MTAADLPVRLVEGCLMALPFDDTMFDLVSAAWSVESTPNPARVVRELLRVLRPGGQLVLVFCSAEPTSRVSSRLLRHTVKLRGTGQFLDPETIIEIAEAAGADQVIRHRCDGAAAALTIRKSAASQNARGGARPAPPFATPRHRFPHASGLAGRTAGRARSRYRYPGAAAGARRRRPPLVRLVPDGPAPRPESRLASNARSARPQPRQPISLPPRSRP